MQNDLSEADIRGRQILRLGTRLQKDCYKYKGTVYWVKEGRVLHHDEAERYAWERKQKGQIEDKTITCRTT